MTSIHRRHRSACVAVLAGLTTSAIAADAGPATTRIETVTDTYHGVTVVDPYRWLEDSGSDEVKAWSAAQNARTRALLDADPRRSALRDELTRMITNTSPSDSDITARGRLIFELYNDPRQQQPVLAALDADAHAASRRVLLDPNVLDRTSGTSIDWFVPSSDSRYVAVSLSKGGSEDGTLHIYDVRTAREIEPAIPRVQYPTAAGSVAWTADSKGFWYTRYPGEEAAPADRHFYQQVYFHRLGADWKDDQLVLGKAQGLPRTAEIFLNNRYGAALALACVQKGDGNEWQHFLLRAASATQVGQYADRIVAASLGPDGALYGISRLDAPNGKVVKLQAPYAGGFARAKTIVSEGHTAIVSEARTQALALTRQHLFVPYIAGGPSAVRVFGHDGAHAISLDLPPVSAVSQIEPLPTGDVLYSVETYLEPRHYARWDATTLRSRATELAIHSPVSYADAEVRREFAVSKDGTRVPLNIISRKDAKLDGAHPTILYGYGGYGISQIPYFSTGTRRLWLDADGVYVIANIRGGSEYGERWHQQGALTHKQAVFDDFYAAARWLIEHQYTSSAKLALHGGSNGGLLMGAVLIQHPELARAVVAEVGIYDMLRVELDPNGEFNTTEYGTVKDAEQFRALFAYSPYHHVKSGTAYPAILLTAGANDGRVNPMQSRKFAAALQAATSSGEPVLLRTSDSSGHGFGTPLAEIIAERADVIAFLMKELGANSPKLDVKHH
jgi:prolyl oligopeptidase